MTPPTEIFCCTQQVSNGTPDWENDYWYGQSHSHQDSQTNNEKKNISSHDSRVGMKQFRLNVFYGERQKKKKKLQVSGFL